MKAASVLCHSAFRHDPELYVKPKGPVMSSGGGYNSRPAPDDLKAKSESTLYHKDQPQSPSHHSHHHQHPHHHHHHPASHGYPARSHPNLESSGLEPDDQKLRNYEDPSRMR